MKLWQCQNLLRAQSLFPSGLCKVTHSKWLGEEVQHRVTISKSPAKPRGGGGEGGSCKQLPGGESPFERWVTQVPHAMPRHLHSSQPAPGAVRSSVFLTLLGAAAAGNMSLTNGALMGKSSFNGRINIRMLNKIMTLSKSV